MSWSINIIGEPEKISAELDAHAKRLEGSNKEEFERALPHLKGLLELNKSTACKFRMEANGHSIFNDNGKLDFSNCFVKLEPIWGVFV
jgi:hypothetical protein